jgi:hypothetical protein
MHDDWPAVALSILPSQETSAARAVISDPKRLTGCAPLYEIDARSGVSIEVFYADRALAGSFGTRPGWFWWSCERGCLPDWPPNTCRLSSAWRGEGKTRGRWRLHRLSVSRPGAGKIR